MVTVSGSGFWLSDLAWLCGRLIGTPTVSSGADTMKTMSSTSMTSTNGVTLISLMTARRRRPCLPLDADAITLPAMVPSPAVPSPAVPSPAVPSPAVPSPTVPSPALVDLPRQDRGEFVGEPLQPLGLLVHLGGELIIENSRRNGGNEANCGCKQRFRDARRHHRQRGILRRRDRLEAGHDAGHGTEQPDEGAGGTHRCQHQKAALHVLDLAGDSDVHHLLDAHLQAGEGTGMAFEAALPFAHGGDEQHAGRVLGLGRERFIKLFKGLAGPEGLLEMVTGL